MSNTNQDEIIKQIEELEDKALMLEITSDNVKQSLILRRNEDVAYYIKYTDILRKHEENYIVLIDEAYNDCLNIVNKLQCTSQDVQKYIAICNDEDVIAYNQYHRAIGSLKYQLKYMNQQQALKKQLKMMTV